MAGMLTPQQVADELSITAGTVRKWVKQKRLKAVEFKATKRVLLRFDPDYIQSLKVQGGFDAGIAPEDEDIDFKALEALHGGQKKNK